MATPGDRPDISEERKRIYDALTHANELQSRGETDADIVMTEINASAVESVPGALYAGVTVVDAEGAVSTVGATNDIAGLLDAIQRDFQEGPCLSAAWNQHTILIEDVQAEQRWTAYRREALQRTPTRSVLSIRLYEQHRSRAALNFYADTPHAFTEESIEVGLVYAAHATLAWNALRREHQFQSALGSRDVIGQAKGMLMERFNIDAVAAFAMLRRLSQESNTKLHEVAERVLDTRGSNG